MITVKRISELRFQNDGMTQRDLAKAINVTQASVSRWEKDQLKISGENLIKLSLFFDVSTDELLGIEEKRQSNEYQFSN